MLDGFLRWRDKMLRKHSYMIDQEKTEFHVLLVDDDVSFSTLVRDVLSLTEEFHFTRALSVKDMWTLLESKSFDVLLLDYKLPDGNGLDLLEDIARRPVDIPVIIITGRGDERLAAQAIQMGAIDYHVKSPETVFELPVLIRKAQRNFAYRTANRRALEKIRYQALLLNNVRDAVVVWDSESRITFWNPAAEKLYGRSAEEQLGRDVRDAYSAIFTPPVPSATPDGTGEAVERCVRTLSGEDIWIGSRITPLTDPDTGAAAGTMDVTRDITPLKATEQRLRERLEFENLITSISTEFISLAADRIDAQVQDALRRVGEYAGVDRAYIFRISEDGKWIDNTHEWCAPDTSPQIGRLQHVQLGAFPWFAEKIRSQDVIQVPQLDALPVEAEAERKEWSGERIGSLINIPMSAQGRLAGFLGFDTAESGREWSEDTVALLKIVGEILFGAIMRQRAELQIRAAQTHLAQSSRLAAIGELAAGVAHQINNPLTAIIAEAQMLHRAEITDPAVREAGEMVEKAGWKAQQAVQHLLEFSRPASDSLALVQVNDTIRKAVRLIGAPIQTTAGLRLDTLLADQLPPIRGSAARLEDLWVNLLMLARDATKDGKTHAISIQSRLSETGSLVVEVADDGQWIPEAEMESIFEPQFAGSVAGRGNGIEYSICREIVRQHGGEIRVSSSPDFGTIFYVTLPTEVGHATGEHTGH